MVSEAPTQGLTSDAIAEAMTHFVGDIEQLPPAYSAKKVKGKKLYELARRGEEVPREAKQVSVYEFSMIRELEEDSIDFRLSCGSGTYARSLAHDLGEALGCGAHLSGLRRTSIGPFQVEEALQLGEIGDRLGEEPEASVLGSAWRSFDSIPLPFEELTIDPQQERRILHGQTVLARELQGAEGDWVKLVNQRLQFVAVGTVTERVGAAGVGIVQPKVVFR